MSVNTIALLTDTPHVIEILRYINENYKDASLTLSSRMYDYYKIYFLDGEDPRILSIFSPDIAHLDYSDVLLGRSAVLVSLGCWGNSEEIAKSLCAKFGGMMTLRDCYQDWVIIPKGFYRE